MNIKDLRRWLPLAVIVLLIIGAWVSGLMDMINLEAIKAQRGQLLEIVAAHPFLSVAGFTFLYAAAVALSLPIATVLTLLGGFLFGRGIGTLVIVIGATVGATVIFLIARSAVGDTLREKAGPLYKKVAINMEKNAFSYMLFIRQLSPVEVPGLVRARGKTRLCLLD